MNNDIKQVLLQLLDSSSDEDEAIFEEFFTTSLSSDDSAADEDSYGDNKDFMSIIEEYSDDEFKSNLRLNRSTVEHLITNYALTGLSSISKHGGKPKIGVRREIYLYLWYMGNTITFSQLGTLFGCAKSSAWLAVKRVSEWLVSKGSEYIKWPQGDAITEARRKFLAETKIPNVIGAIGSIHITIPTPKRNKHSYRSCKHNFQKFALVLQAVVDADHKFTDICCGEPGSFNDNNVLKRSALFKNAHTHISRLFPSDTFLLGYAPYSVNNWIVTPFNEDEKFTDRKQSFNNLHLASRSVVERAFSLFTQRFRKLNEFKEERNLSAIKKIIVSACVLHNLCISNNDHFTITKEENPALLLQETTDRNHRFPYNTRRQHLFSYLCKKNIL